MILACSQFWEPHILVKKGSYKRLCSTHLVQGTWQFRSAVFKPTSTQEELVSCKLKTSWLSILKCTLAFQHMFRIGFNNPLQAKFPSVVYNGSQQYALVSHQEIKPFYGDDHKEILLARLRTAP